MLDPHPQLSSFEQISDRTAQPSPITDPGVTNRIERPSFQPSPTDAETSIQLEDTEFSEERPGPAWIWEFGIMG